VEIILRTTVLLRRAATTGIADQRLLESRVLAHRQKAVPGDFQIRIYLFICC
jgi:hypothetical protein